MNTAQHTSQVESHNDLIGRLSALRGIVRRRLLAYGVFAVMAGGVAAFLTIITLDWLVWLPPLLRGFGTLCFVVGFLASTWYWVVHPLQARIGIDELAGYLEQHFHPLQDRLSSTVNFLASGDVATSSLMREVVEGTQKLVQQTPLEAALSARPIFVRACIFAGSAIALLFLVSIAPQWAATGVRRYANPWGPVEWPRFVQLDPLTKDQVVAIGDSAKVRVRIERGISESLRPVVHLMESDGRVNKLALQMEEPGVFATTLDAVASELNYWFEAGDDSTEKSPFRIKVVPRPEVVEAFATIEPPSYAVNRALRVLDLAEGAVTAPAGGFATVAVRSSKPVEAGASGLRLDDGEWISLQADVDENSLRVRVELVEDLRFQIELHDRDGFENRGASTYAIRVSPDKPPQVVIASPQSMVEVTPTGSIPLVIQATDDFGITSVGLEIERPDGANDPRLDLSTFVAAQPVDEGAGAVVSYDWRLESLHGVPGDVFVYSAVAIDNKLSPEGEGQVGRSPAMRLKFISEQEFDLRLREEFMLVETRLRQVATEQADNRDRTVLLTEGRESGEALSPKDRDSAAGLGTAQGRLARQLKDLSWRLAAMEKRARANRREDVETLDRVAAIRGAVDSLASGPVTTAGTSLEQVQQDLPGTRQQELLRAATEDQDKALEQMQSIIRSLSQWGAFHGMISRTRDLLDRQADLQKRTKAISDAMLGKSISELSPEQAANLRVLERQQDQLAGDIEQQLARMKQMSESSKEKDAAGAESLDAAVRVGRALDAVKHATQAKDAIAGNRTAVATVEQKAAGQALRKMIEALRDREERELAELRKKIDRAEDEVAALIEEQSDLRAVTVETQRIQPGEAEFQSLSESEQTIERNTRMLSEEMVEDDRLATVGGIVRQASLPMARAAAALSRLDGSEAAARQDDAIAGLKKALEELRAIAQASEEEALLRTLDQVEDQLATILESQVGINKGLGALREDIAKAGKLGRSEAREAAKLAKQQGENRTGVDDLLPELEQVPVYSWALERVSGWMKSSQEALEERRVNDDLTATTDRIVRELQKLLGAIEETRRLPFSDEFAGGQGSGEGASGAKSVVLVPTVAELLVLRTMQTDINLRTKTLGAADPDAASEAELRDLKSLGEDQAEVRRLTEKLTAKNQQQ